MTDEHPGDGWRRAVERLEAAMNTLMSGDASAIKALYSHRDDVTAFFGWGGYEKGWAEVSRRWDWAAAQFQGGGPVRYEHLTAVTAPGLAVTTHVESTRVLIRRHRPAERVVEPRDARLSPRGRGVAAGPPPREPPGGPVRARHPAPLTAVVRRGPVRRPATECGRAGRCPRAPAGRRRRARSVGARRWPRPHRPALRAEGARRTELAHLRDGPSRSGRRSSGPRGRAEIALRPPRGPAHTRGGSVARSQLRCLPTAPTNARTSRDDRPVRPIVDRHARRLRDLCAGPERGGSACSGGTGP